jgi:hypothetical protein
MENLNNNRNKILEIREKVNNLDNSLFDHHIINNCEINNNAVSIVMTASNRSKQTYFSLQSMLKSKCKNIQIIIVDDSDIDPLNINILKNYPYYIDLIVIKKENKNWINPVVNYNLGFKFIKGDNVVIQNAEVCHIGDPLYFIYTEMKENNYYVFDVGSVSCFENNEEIYKDDITTIDIYNKRYYNVWYQHYIRHNRYFHFFTSLKRETFNLIKEFSYDYTMGINYDDDDFVFKIKCYNINLVNIENDKYNMGSIHLYHSISYSTWGVGVKLNLEILKYKVNYYNDNKKYIDCLDLIPKIFFTYWEGNTLTKLHYYTIKSLLKYNPEINIIIYTSKIVSNTFIQWLGKAHENIIIKDNDDNKNINLKDLVNIDNQKIRLIEIDFQEEYNFDTDISIIFKADFIRISKLYEHGGLWFDMDLLFINKVPDYFFNSNYDILYYYYTSEIATGLIGSTPKNKYITKLYENALDIIKNINKNDRNLPYQKIGPDLWTSTFKDNNELTKNTLCVETNTAYPYIWTNILDFFYTNKSNIDDNTFCIHWYNGDPEVKKISYSFDEKLINPENSVFERVIYNIIN